MKDLLIRRRAELKEQFAKGQAQLADLDLHIRQLKDTLLRISGAIQVLDETLADSEAAEDAPASFA